MAAHPGPAPWLPGKGAPRMGTRQCRGTRHRYRSWPVKRGGFAAPASIPAARGSLIEGRPSREEGQKLRDVPTDTPEQPVFFSRAVYPVDGECQLAVVMGKARARYRGKRG